MPDIYFRPCPFCGSTRAQTAEVIAVGQRVCFAWCMDCYAQGPKSNNATNAAALWNKRSERPRQSGDSPHIYDTSPALMPDLSRNEKEMNEILDKFLKGKNHE